jgi:hypothetical protein
VLDFDDIPGQRCTPVGWSESRKFRVTENGGSWLQRIADVSEDKGYEDCATHRRGMFIKMGWEDSELIRQTGSLTA